MARAKAFNFLYLVVPFFQLHFTISKPVGFSPKLIPRDSSQSPLSLTQVQTIHSSVEFSKSRANHLATMNPNNIFLPLNRNIWQYSVKIGIGQPSREVTLLVDTSSGLTWTHCRSSMYYSPNSKTYEQLRCNHTMCRKLFKCVNGQCVYKVSYGIGTGSKPGTTKGVVSLDAIILPLRDRTRKLFYRFVFGCSNDKNGLPGILGLNRSPVSLINQLNSDTKRRFSYCLHSGQSYVTFGDDVALVVRGRNFTTTPFVNPKLPQYHLKLVDISVGSVRLRLSEGYFSARNRGCIIDSRSPYTVFAKKAYGKVIEAFAKYYDRKLERVNGSGYGLELCYKYREGFELYASMKFHFLGGDLAVSSRHVHVFNLQVGHLCVALVSGDRTVLGALQQWGTRFVYDLNANVLQFVPENCTDGRG